MKSTGEVMGVGKTFAEAFVKSQMAASVRLPLRARCSSASRTPTSRRSSIIARDLHAEGFTLLATRGTAKRDLRGGN
jgi:carbamoyl-phosphate synthase large subunit